MNKKIKSLSKSLFKEINQLDNVKKTTKEKTIEAIKKIILGEVIAEGQTIVTFILSDFKGNKAMNLIVEKSNLKNFVEQTYLKGEEVNMKNALEQINNVQLDHSSFYDFIMISILFRDFINLSQVSKIHKFLKEETWINTPLSKYMFFLSINAFQENDLKLQNFFQVTPLIFTNYWNIAYWISEILQFKNIPTKYHKTLSTLLDFISNSNINSDGKFENEPTVKLLKMIVDSYMNDQPADQPVYWVIQFLKQKIELEEFTQKLEGYITPLSDKKYLFMKKEVAFIWHLVINKIIIHNTPLHMRAFLSILILTYKDIGQLLFDVNFINYIRESLEHSRFRMIFIEVILQILKEEKRELTKLEEVLWETTIAAILVEEKSVKKYMKFATENKLKMTFLYVHMKTITLLGSDEDIKKYIKSQDLLLDEPSKVISSLELALINEETFDLDKVQDVLENPDYANQAPFIYKMLFTRYAEIKFKNIKHEILKNHYERIMDNSITVIKSGEKNNKDKDIDKLKKNIQDMNAISEDQRINILERLEGASTSLIAQFLGGGIWRQISNLKIKKSDTAQKISSESSYFLSLFDFICSLKGKTPEEIKKLFLKIEENKIKLYIYESHVEDLTNDTINEGVLNSDKKFRRLLTVDDELKLIENENSKLWENQVYWMIIENINKIFFLVADTGLVFIKYFFMDGVFLNDKKVTTITPSKLENGELKLMVGDYEW